MVGKSPSWISKVETGEIRIRPEDLARLCTAYGHSLPDRTAVDLLYQLKASAEEQGWWEPFADVLPRPDQGYLAFEYEARDVRSYELALIPGLLQTEDYARAVLLTREWVDDHQTIEWRVRARMQRQAILTRPRPVHLHAVISEAAVHFEVGGRNVRQEQMRHLAKAAKQPNIIIQILEFAAGATPAAQGAFTLLGFDDAPDLLSVEQQQRSTSLSQDAEEVDSYADLFDYLSRSALTPGESLERMEQRWT